MAEPDDVWFIRLPDGRVLRAGSTASVRHHLESGEIPPDSRVRRAHGEAWVFLERTSEFADLVPHRSRTPAQPPAARRPASSRLLETDANRAGAPVGGLHLHTVDVRGGVTELLTALESTFVRGRLLGAGAVTVAAAVLVLLANRTRLGQDVWPPLPWVAAGLVALFLQALYAAYVTQATFVELSTLRPARAEEARAGLLRNALRVVLVELCAPGGLLLLIGGLRWLGSWLAEPPDGSVVEAIVGAAAVVRLVLEVVFWPVAGLSLLLAPVVVIEEASPPRVLWQWGALLRQHLSRVFVYEALAAALGLITTLPLLVPVTLAAWACSPAELANPVVRGALGVLFGVALAPLLAYVTVANLFIYLNLRYEHAPSAR